ncbi:undecaprenyl-diphosphate phosphatase [Phycicoccus endophyticus]|uniref:Undecaprenyl-diphosphatase n=1 Tax=Phycicoccus endophyticus TaxID=1690220 RepID=A0A7G9R4H3_9MICO|nr:undecaprenyl-diphosphate phosphatase [Phycicoccus endophyticus]NHI18383.1 undecaprenyl-diphosphate phosphatase [Phycicoccus endophyticus]QNN50498.1 undecaprenyl-diphosphate phosphatase [Phycicoccus endophyticus]GGL24239.1 undecaprenyl-diphosphatase 1 [Phycicoccus endophyticus]
MPVELSYLQAVVLGVVEGLTEFLPISSTGHLTVVEHLLGLPVDAPAVTAYTAIIQIGAIVATFIYFARKIARLFLAWVHGLRDAEARTDRDYRLAWAVVVGSIPVGLVGFALKDVIAGPLRSLWVVAAGLVLWSAVIWVAEQRHDILERRGEQRGEEGVTVRDGLVIGLVQCFSLIPGVSRSGATISAGLIRGIDRVTATELSFFMAIPALTAAGLFELVDAWGDLKTLGAGQMLVGIVVAFVTAYASIAWLLRFVATNSLRAFIGYRVALGAALVLALAAGWLSAT